MSDEKKFDFINELENILAQAKRVNIDELNQRLRIITLYWNSLKYLPYKLIGYPLTSLYIKSNEKGNPKRFLIILALFQQAKDRKHNFLKLDCEVFPPLIVKAEVSKELAKAIKIVYEAEKEELEELKEKPLEIVFKGNSSFELNILKDEKVPSLSQFAFMYKDKLGDIKAYVETLRQLREQRKVITEAQFDELYSLAFMNEIKAYKECLKKKEAPEEEITSEEDELLKDF